MNLQQDVFVNLRTRLIVVVWGFQLTDDVYVKFVGYNLIILHRDQICNPWLNSISHILYCIGGFMVYFHKQKIRVHDTVFHWLSLPNVTRNETSARTPYFYIAFLKWKHPEVGLGAVVSVQPHKLGGFPMLFLIAGKETGDVRINVTLRSACARCVLSKEGYTHTHTHSEMVIRIVFPLQQWLNER
jgi:hypothetical protein